MKDVYFIIHESGFAYPFALTETEMNSYLSDQPGKTHLRTLGVYKKIGNYEVSIKVNFDYHCQL